MQINVQGGTNAGWRKVRQALKNFVCENCGARLKYYWLACPVCNHPRPSED